MTDRQITHATGCRGWGPRHYECAVKEIEHLQAEVERLAEALKKVAQSLDWYAHGRCRGFDDGAPLSTNEAVELAARTLAKVRA